MLGCVGQPDAASVILAGDPVAVTIHVFAVARLACVERCLAEPAHFVAARISHAALDFGALAGAHGQGVDQRHRVSGNVIAEAEHQRHAQQRAPCRSLFLSAMLSRHSQRCSADLADGR